MFELPPPTKINRILHIYHFQNLYTKHFEKETWYFTYIQYK